MRARAISRQRDGRRWPGVALIIGGAIMVATWPIFTTLHGPTSVNEGGELLGLDGEFWGAIVEGPSLLLIAAGLVGARHVLVAGGGRGPAVGWWLVVVGLVLTALAAIAVLAPWPPLLAPIVAAGLFLLGRGHRGSEGGTRRVRLLLYAMGATQLFALLWSLVVRPDMLDRIDGYRIYGLVANVAFGLGWVLLGAAWLGRVGMRRAGALV